MTGVGGRGGKIHTIFLCCPGNNKEGYLKNSRKIWNTNEIGSFLSVSELTAWSFPSHAIYPCSILTFNFYSYSSHRSNDTISWLIFSKCHVLWLAFSMHYTIQKVSRYFFIMHVYSAGMWLCHITGWRSEDNIQALGIPSCAFPSSMGILRIWLRSSNLRRVPLLVKEPLI